MGLFQLRNPRPSPWPLEKGVSIMSSALMLDRTSTTSPGFTYPYPATSSPGVSTYTTPPAVGNWFMVPRCTFKFEKIANGYKVFCYCDDKVACSMVQNLCTMLAGSTPSFGCYFNGTPVCSCCFTACYCKWETIEQGVCFTFTSGDPQCCKMVQCCCENLCCCYENGCTCCFFYNNTPVCCGYFGEFTPKSGKSK
jgi:hypothetical protein